MEKNIHSLKWVESRNEGKELSSLNIKDSRVEISRLVESGNVSS